MCFKWDGWSQVLTEQKTELLPFPGVIFLPVPLSQILGAPAKRISQLSCPDSQAEASKVNTWDSYV